LLKIFELLSFFLKSNSIDSLIFNQLLLAYQSLANCTFDDTLTMYHREFLIFYLYKEYLPCNEECDTKGGMILSGQASSNAD